MARGSLSLVVMAAPGLHDVLVRWNPFRGYWVDNGFGVNPWHEFYPTQSAAVRVAQSLLSHPASRVLVQQGAEWHVAAVPALVDAAAVPQPVRVRTRPRS